MYEHNPPGQRPDPPRWQQSAIPVLQEATEVYITSIFEAAMLAVLNEGVGKKNPDKCRQTVMAKDLRLMEILEGRFNPLAGEITREYNKLKEINRKEPVRGQRF
jgi:histone H3/H4